MGEKQEYEVVLDGGSKVAVVPAGTVATPESVVLIYDRANDRWMGEHHIQSVIAHGDWPEPEEKTVLLLDPPPPAEQPLA